MRLVDAIEDRIIIAPPVCSYVVLSYVWGRGDYLQLLNSNLEDMAEKGALRNINVPNTISHAIQITKALGERYLWVDSLCIVQDDDGQKAVQIQNMNKIYSSATLTLVAADQSHANGGLWRPNPAKPRDYEQAVEEIGGLVFIGSAPTLEELLETVMWPTRAWTYQEDYLSRRYMYFSDYQVYFCCETMSLAEDYIDRVSEFGIKQAEHANDDETFRKVWSASVRTDRWEQVIRDYSRRCLTYDSDGLNAVAGVLEHLAKGMEDGFICGLPVSILFESGLLWYSASSLRRRSPTPSGAFFPSWSWVGWVGEVRYEPFEESSAIVESRVIFEWWIEHPHGILRSSTLSFPLADGLMNAANCTPEETQQATRSIKAIQTGILCFETMVARFMVDSTCWNQYTFSDDFDCLQSGLYKIISNNVWIGSVHLEHSTARDICTGTEELHEFVVLSKSSESKGLQWVTRRPLDDQNEAVFLYSEELEKEGEDAYNVLLITEEKHEVLRRGVGQIHKATFEKSNWTSKIVRLS
jgi:hypothetical protein